MNESYFVVTADSNSEAFLSEKYHRYAGVKNLKKRKIELELSKKLMNGVLKLAWIMQRKGQVNFPL